MRRQRRDGGEACGIVPVGDQWCSEGVDLLDAHQRAMAQFDHAVHHVRDDQWDRPTPCTEWSVRVLVNHLVCEQLWVPHLIRGETIGDVGNRYEGDVLGADPVKAWERAAADARNALTAPGALTRSVHLSYGDDSADSYAWQLISDLAVHSWDLATAIGSDPAIDDELATTVYTWAQPLVNQWRDFGIFAPPVPVPHRARPTDRLVALLGRQPLIRSSRAAAHLRHATSPRSKRGRGRGSVRHVRASGRARAVPLFVGSYLAVWALVGAAVYAGVPAARVCRRWGGCDRGRCLRGHADSAPASSSGSAASARASA